MKKQVWMSWSTGKDSAYALHSLLSHEDIEVTGLFTTLTREFDRVSMHGVREVLLDVQAERLGIPLHKVYIPFPCPNGAYESAMRQLIAQAKEEGVQAFGFGDLYLTDIREYREKQMSGTGIELLFPAWEKDTQKLSRDLLQMGFEAIITCVDEAKMSPDFCGRTYNEAFLNSLESQIDPCGENGEFHTFVYNSPSFKKPIPVEVGERVSREGFTFADLRLLS